jgi:isopenicillin N synthase-like dioxygenase
MIDVTQIGTPTAREAERFGASQVVVESLPIIDFSAFSEVGSEAYQQAIAQQFKDVCNVLGFFYLSHHGLPDLYIPETFEWSRQFFELRP